MAWLARRLGTSRMACYRIFHSYSIDTQVLFPIMGVVFQLPVVAFFLGKMGIVNAEMLSKYRKHAFLIIMLAAAAITPPDLMTLILVTIPLYLLYEVSLRVVRRVTAKS